MMAPVAPPPMPLPTHEGETLVRLGKELTKVLSIQLLGYLCAHHLLAPAMPAVLQQSECMHSALLLSR